MHSHQWWRAWGEGDKLFRIEAWARVCCTPSMADAAVPRCPSHGLPRWLSGEELSGNAGDPGSIPGLGSSPGEGTAYPLQCSLASLVAQLVKNPLAMQETWVQSLGWEDPLEKEKVTHSSILAWRIPWTEESDGLQSMGSQRVRHNWATKPPPPCSFHYFL